MSATTRTLLLGLFYKEIVVHPLVRVSFDPCCKDDPTNRPMWAALQPQKFVLDGVGRGGREGAGRGGSGGGARRAWPGGAGQAASSCCRVGVAVVVVVGRAEWGRGRGWGWGMMLIWWIMPDAHAVPTQCPHSATTLPCYESAWHPFRVHCPFVLQMPRGVHAPAVHALAPLLPSSFAMICSVHVPIVQGHTLPNGAPAPMDVVALTSSRDGFPPL